MPLTLKEKRYAWAIFGLLFLGSVITTLAGSKKRHCLDVVQDAMKMGMLNPGQEGDAYNTCMNYQ